MFSLQWDIASYILTNKHVWNNKDATFFKERSSYLLKSWILICIN
jgi:hypothetical protein